MNKLQLIERKSEYIKRLISNSKKSKSLSNDVHTTNSLVIKKYINNSNSGQEKELHILNLLRIDHIKIDEYLVIEKKPGKNIKIDSLSNPQMIKNLDSEINNLKKINVSKDIIKPVSFITKIEGNDSLFDFFKRNNLCTTIIDEIISISAELPENQLCHGDLNQNNILMHNNNITLIDYEEVCFGNKYHDYSILISNWDLDISVIEFICKLKGLEIEILIKYSIVWGGLFGIWNERNFSETKNKKYNDFLEYINLRIAYLYKHI